MPHTGAMCALPPAATNSAVSRSGLLLVCQASSSAAASSDRSPAGASSGHIQRVSRTSISAAAAARLARAARLSLLPTPASKAMPSVVSGWCRSPGPVCAPVLLIRMSPAACPGRGR